MKHRWLLMVGLVFALTAMSVAAMPTDRGQDLADTPMYDIRPFLAEHPIPASVLRELQLTEAYRPPPFVPDAQQAYSAVIDDFEAQNLRVPAVWVTFDLDGPLNGEYKWALSQCRSSEGLQSLWAIGGGEDGRLLQCGARYPNAVVSVAVLRLDLSGWPEAPDNPRQLDLLFDMWLNTRSEPVGPVVGDGLFLNYVRILEGGGQEQIVIRGLTSQFPEDWWDEVRVDLTDVHDMYDQEAEHYNLSGKDDILLQFLFKTKIEPGGELTEGVFIDNVRLEASAPPTPTATFTPDPEYTPPTPTSTITPTLTSTATVSPTPTEGTPPTPTATPTATSEPPTGVFLPIAYNGAGVDEGTPPPEPTEPPAPTEPPVEPTTPAPGPTDTQLPPEPTELPTAGPTP